MSEFEEELSVLRTRHNMLMDALGFKRDANLEGVVIEDVRRLRPEMVKARQTLYSAQEFDELAQVFWEEKSQFAAKLWRMGRSYLQRAQDAEQQVAVLRMSHDSAVRATLIREKALKIAAKEYGGDAICFLWLGKAERFLVENGTITAGPLNDLQLSLANELAVKLKHPNATLEYNQCGDDSWILVKTDHDADGDAARMLIGSGLTEDEAWESAARRVKKGIARSEAAPKLEAEHAA